MNFKYILNVLTVAILYVSASIPSNADNIHIYRNDGNFNSFRSTDSLSLTHRLEGEGSLLHRDSIEIPLSVIDSIVVRQIDVPVLRFSFPEDPELGWVKEKETYIKALLSVEGNGLVESADSLILTVKGRGNSTWWFPKKPMRLKFSSKTSLCGLTKAKSYVLLADFMDPSLMRNAATLWLAKKMGVNFVNDFVPCHVYVNDNYAGAYLLTHKIGINKASVNINENTGVLIEMSTELDEPYQFRSFIYNLPVMIKDPDLGELAAESEPTISAETLLGEWRKDFYDAEVYVLNGMADRAFDLRSFVDVMIINNIALNNEIGHPKSFYLYKERQGKETPYKFGPVWDYDLAYNSDLLSDGKATVTPYDGELWIHPFFEELMRHPLFQGLVKERFAYFESEVYPEFLEWFDTYSHLIEPLARQNGLRWPGSYKNQWVYRKNSTFDNLARTEELKKWIERRVKVLHKRIEKGEF